jgi:hypothetical protein
MVPDCIDPEARDFLREILSKSVAEIVADCWWHDIGSGFGRNQPLKVSTVWGLVSAVGIEPTTY